MHNPRRRPPSPTAYITLGMLATGAAVMLGTRIYQAATGTHPTPAVDTTSAVATALLVIATLAHGWRCSLLSAHADRDNLAEQVAELREQVDDLETQAWWTSPGDDKPPSELPANVIPLPAGGSGYKRTS